MLSSLEHIDFLYGFIYKCANLIKKLYDYDNYDRLVIKLCSEFVVTSQDEYLKIKDFVDNNIDIIEYALMHL